MEKCRPRPPAGPDGGRGHPVPQRRRRRRRRHRPAAARPLRRRRARHRRDRAARPAGARAASSTACMQAMDYLPPANRVALGEAGRGPGHRRRARTSSSSAAATPAPTASAPRTARAPASVTQLEIMPRPGEERPAGQPWPTYPMIYRVASAHEEGGERVYAVSTKEFLGDDDGQVRGAAAGRGRAGRRPASSRSRAPSGRSRPSWCCSPWASSGRSGRASSSSSASSSTSAATSSATSDYMTSVPGVFVAGDAGRGQSLIVWAIAEGRVRAPPASTAG